uniref:Serine peptidase inhibitor Kazal type 4 n=1 Tax=Cebus imitator TaxID=2715852 RepID=A0A2K5R1H5_CEBIM
VILGIGSSPHLLWMLEGTDRWPLPDHLLKAGLSFTRMVRQLHPICEHMVESPTCSQTSNLVCGTDGVTYTNECQLCLARIKTKQDIQITKDGKC